MGNPPYNALQVSFNDANPADKYPDIDQKIEETWSNTNVKKGSTKYDMYKRFLKWSSERIKKNGMVVFISNNSFLDAKSDDGFRRAVYDEFDYIYTVNLKGNARTSGGLRREQAGNVFRDTIKVGITISFFVKTGENKSEIHYTEIDNYLKSEEKLKWLADNSLSTLSSREIMPDKEANWLNQTNNDFDELVPVVTDDENSLFELLSMGTMSSKDDWVYSFDKNDLVKKIKYYINFYNDTLKKYSVKKQKPRNTNIWIEKKIKWSADTLKHLKRGNSIIYSKKEIINTLYRPFVQKYEYSNKIITHRQRKFPQIFPDQNSNKIICFVNPKTNILFQTLATNKITSYDCIPGAQCIPLYTYNKNILHNNITKFALDLFQKHYQNQKITDEDIFYYAYAIFNDPKYSKKYKFDLQRKFPRIPLARDFTKWSDIGKKLYDLHVGFESAKPYPLKRIDKKTNKNNVKLSLKKSKEEGKLSKIVIDEQTTLEDIPDDALRYKFSSKCALEWILEFYKESKNMIDGKSCDDPKIRKKFNTYRFADHKEHVIDLLRRVTTVSVETMRLRTELENMPWGKQPKLNLDKSKEEQTISKVSKKTKKSKKSRKKKIGMKNIERNQKRLF